MKMGHVHHPGTDTIEDKINETVNADFCKYETEKMARHQAFWLGSLQHISFRKIFAASCFISTFSLFWLQIATKQQETTTERLIQEALSNVGRDLRYTNIYRTLNNLPKDLKYVLLWTRKDYAPFYYLGEGQKAFLVNNCSVNNCYVTDNRSLFNGDATKFDAIAFNGRNMDTVKLPTIRSQHQKYIFVNTESADNYPVCNHRYEDFFNWTFTYRLDSDIKSTYILIRGKNGSEVGPKLQMQWEKYKPKILHKTREFKGSKRNKTKAAAWFVSNCSTRSNRSHFVKSLKKALSKYGLTIDIYGDCGTMKCPMKDSECDYILNRDYYFYLALENSFSEDYVSEKLLTALKNDIIPIVYGGADYARFLPPGSYINARNQRVDKLAKIMYKLMSSPKAYNKYFWWKSYYTYHDPKEKESVCNLCEALNNKEMVQSVSRYQEFRKWWNPNFKSRCRKH